MALELSHEDRYGATHASAYHRITTLLLYFGALRAKVEVSTYNDSTARNGGKEPYLVRTYVIDGADYTTVFGVDALDVESVNCYSSAYSYLKTLDDYSGASDV